MSEQPGHGGRPINNFVEEFFTKLEREKEGSTRWYYRCTFCPNSRLLHRDNRLFRLLGVATSNGIISDEVFYTPI